MNTLLRTLILSVVLLISAAQAAHACNGQLLFKGVAKNVENCQFNIDFTYVGFNDSCPMVQEDIKQKVFGSCNVKEGDEVSGIINRANDGSFFIER